MSQTPEPAQVDSGPMRPAAPLLASQELRTVTGRAPIVVSFQPPARQRRVTVAFRIILLVPHAIALWALGLAASIVAFIGWFAALFTGQLPEWAHDFLTGFLRWSTRVYSYEFLLTDVYPPFSLDDSDYPVRLFTAQTRLNRLAVLFRIVLVIPAYVLAVLLALGLSVMSLIAWLITLVAGQLPAGLHDAFAAMVRYLARSYGYYYLATPEYPAGLYGDQAKPTGLADPWRLPLSGNAKAIVTATLLIGLAVVGSLAAVAASAGSRAGSDTTALAAVQAANARLIGVVSGFEANTKACGQDLSCVTREDGQVALAFQVFGNALAQAGVPASDVAEVTALRSENDQITTDFSKLATAQSATQYASVGSGMELTSVLSLWQTDYNHLRDTLAGS